MSADGFFAEYDKRGAASCKKCKVKLNKGELRLGKSAPNPFSDSGGTLKQWFHASCLFEVWKKARASTPVLQACCDLLGWNDLKPEDKQLIEQLFQDMEKLRSTKTPAAGNPKKKNKIEQQSPEKTVQLTSPETARSTCLPTVFSDPEHADNSFRQFRKIVNKVASVSGHIDKSNIVKDYFSKGTTGKFEGEIMLWLRFLLPGVVKRIYNLQTKQLLKLFSQIFRSDHDAMVEHSHQSGDVAATVSQFFDSPSSRIKPSAKSCLTLKKVDELLEELSGVTTEEEQLNILEKISKQCTVNDLEMVLRLIKHDLRMGAGAKPILTGFHPNAYEAFQATRDLSVVVKRFAQPSVGNAALFSATTSSLATNFGIQIMTPVLPMLAAPCRELGKVLASYTEGLYAEIKYDGERVQVHAHEGKFEFYSRSLKPVLSHKVAHVIEHLPRAFPTGNALVLDCEVLLIDTNTGQPLPFGTLGVHKKSAFKDASVCLFVFDCLHLNGQDITKRSLKERRRILEQHMEPIEHRILLSDLTLVEDLKELRRLTMKTLSEGLEGLVLKDPNGHYQPGKRGWFKVKRDYLDEGAMADSADLVVLGAWYGTGAKGGLLSIFLMGCYDEMDRKWRTVTKVHSGHDDATINRLQKELDMVKVVDGNVPSWLKCHKTMIPHLVAKNPENSPVWEIMGAEFTKHEIHTANGISIRFPRVTRIRDDKSWKEATTLQELIELYKKSLQKSDLLVDDAPDAKCKQKLSKVTASPAPVKKIKQECTLVATSPAPVKKIKEECTLEAITPVPVKKRKKEGVLVATSPVTHKSAKRALPALFTDLSFYVDGELQCDRGERTELCHYIKAYDGLVADRLTSSVDYIIVSKSKDADARQGSGSSKIRLQEMKSKLHLQAAWVWDCITFSTRLSTDNYVVKA